MKPTVKYNLNVAPPTRQRRASKFIPQKLDGASLNSSRLESEKTSANGPKGANDTEDIEMEEVCVNKPLCKDSLDLTECGPIKVMPLANHH